MAKYILKQAAIFALTNEANTHSNPVKRAYTRAAAIIERITAEDVQPVKNGRWISSGRDNDYNFYCRCSRCNYEIVMYRDSEQKPPNYCENCGAKMNKEE